MRPRLSGIRGRVPYGLRGLRRLQRSTGAEGRRRRGRLRAFEHVDGDRDLPVGVLQLERPLRKERPWRQRIMNGRGSEQGQREDESDPTTTPEALRSASRALLIRVGRGRVRRRRGRKTCAFARAVAPRPRRTAPGPLRLTGHGSPRFRPHPARHSSLILLRLAPACRSLCSLYAWASTKAEKWIDGARNRY